MVTLRVAGFEGPLDLLLTLIESRELEITAVSLVQVADQYLAAVAALQAETDDRARADSLGQFLVIGTKLMLLKSRALLPRLPQPEAEAEEDVGRELIDMLEEYRRYRDAVELLALRDRSGLRSFPRRQPVAVDLTSAPGLPDTVTLDVLTRLVKDALERSRQREDEPPVVPLQRDAVTVSEKMADLRGRLRDGRVSFRAWVAEARTWVEVIVTFLAILELYKSCEIEMRQDDTYGDILVEAQPGMASTAASPAASPGAAMDEPSR